LCCSSSCSAAAAVTTGVGGAERTLVPCFRTPHYDVAISYVGHAERWDRIDIKGRIAKRDCTVDLCRGGKTLAVVTIGRDPESLRVEIAMEQDVLGKAGSTNGRG